MMKYSKDWKFFTGLLLLGPTSWALTTTGISQIESSQIIREARRIILHNWKIDGLDIQLDVLKGLGDLKDLPANSRWRIEWGGAKPFSGLLSLPVVIFHNDQVIKRVLVVFKTRLTRNVVTVAKNIERFENLKADQFVITRQECLLGIDSYVTDISFIEGKRALRKLTASSPLLKHYIEENPLVKKGDRVSVIHKSGPVEIIVRGIARADGQQGDTIDVMNLQSKRMMSAYIREDRQLELSSFGDKK